MRVRPDQLERHLRRGLASIYVVHGDEPLQREESLDAIRSAARVAGFAERIVLHAEASFDWSELGAHAANLSLFAERRLIDLRVPGGSPGKEGGPTLARYATDPPPDMLLLMSCGRLDRRSTATKWFRALEAAGDVVEVHPVRPRDLPRWIVDRSASSGVTVERDAAELLAQRSEGNLLACAQEIDKLGLLAQARSITVDDVMRTVSDSARFGAFDLIDPALEGDGARVVRILQVLREEGVEPIHVLGSLTWAIRGVCGIAAGLEGGARIDDVLRAGFGAWWRRKHLIQRALGRMPRRGWVGLLETAEGVDRILKGATVRSGAVVRWTRADSRAGLERLALAMCGVKLPPAAPYN